MTEYVCLTLIAAAGETEAEFKARLTAFWTHLLRKKPDDYARVYAESTRFTESGGTVARQYMVELDAVDTVTAALTGQGVAFVPVDVADTYSKYEATSPDWFQIEH